VTGSVEAEGQIVTVQHCFLLSHPHSSRESVKARPSLDWEELGVLVPMASWMVARDRMVMLKDQEFGVWWLLVGVVGRAWDSAPGDTAEEFDNSDGLAVGRVDYIKVNPEEVLLFAAYFQGFEDEVSVEYIQALVAGAEHAWGRQDGALEELDHFSGRTET
jgi:hypothetical protein